MGSGTDLPERIGVYTVERRLGAGGMGTVYLARSRGGRAVAVKVVRPELAADRQFRERFRAEVDAARRVGGFHTAPVVGADPDAETPWLATAYIPGPTLSGLLADQGPMGEHRLRLLGAALAEALQAIHGCGLVHRDLKPGNIVMAEDGPRVLDFGIARALESTRLTATGAAFGTPGFLAPEQAQGLEVSGAADVFALGAVLVAAAGGSAFGTGTPIGLMYRSVHEPADLSAVPEDLRSLAADCLSKDPAHRPTPERLLELFLPGPATYTPTLVPPGTEAPTLPEDSRPQAGEESGTDSPETVLIAAAGPSDGGTHGDALTLGSGSQDILPARDEIGTAGPRRPTGGKRSRRRILIMVLVATAATGALVGGAVYLTQQGDHTDAPSASPSGSRQGSSPSPEPTPANSGGTGVPKDEVTVLISGEDGRSWVSAKDADGQLLFDGVLNKGETKTFTDKERIDLVLGDAAAVGLVVNGRKVRNDSPPGQVERLTYTRND
ncbi:serine/threonine protein kinase [Streptomyces umbrinus]|uniref:Serine/threonine protein kinase n=1 Tax=Streptomyces umbrinus TaxID=67370 RepID=A0ABU0SS92_9ACTN|nr:RodZ domain-containing protein [Streptomyces umbrinus]MDQ1026393.1 serine/threonine protein kinase [Streptomyces umbrinus]